MIKVSFSLDCFLYEEEAEIVLSINTNLFTFSRMLEVQLCWDNKEAVRKKLRTYYEKNV